MRKWTRGFRTPAPSTCVSSLQIGGDTTHPGGTIPTFQKSPLFQYAKKPFKTDVWSLPSVLLYTKYKYYLLISRIVCGYPLWETVVHKDVLIPLPFIYGKLRFHPLSPNFPSTHNSDGNAERHFQTIQIRYFQSPG
jgi:hypothetical protein